MILWISSYKNKNTTMIDRLQKNTYNYYRQADIKKMAFQAKKERIIKLSQFN